MAGEQLFDTLIPARFIQRIHRFAVRCRLQGSKKVVDAHLPNSGRLWGILVPDAILYLSPVHRPERRLNYTAVAAEKGGKTILLHTGKTKRIARYLLENRLIPRLDGYRVVREEFPLEGSRIDLLLEKDGENLLLEVKSCTQFHEGVALFPDAPTERGHRHLQTLVQYDGPAGILFIVHDPEVSVFLPDYHTDPLFSETLYHSKDNLLIQTVCIGWDRELTLPREIREPTIPWQIYEREARNRGAYLLLFSIPEEQNLPIGALGKVIFRPGYYIYTGSAMVNLSARIRRHKRRRKVLKWHIDYLLRSADSIKPLPIVTSRRIECEISKRLKGLADWIVHGFGASDCSCSSHLFGFKTDPLLSPPFVSFLLKERMESCREVMASLYR